MLPRAMSAALGAICVSTVTELPHQFTCRDRRPPRGSNNRTTEERFQRKPNRLVSESTEAQDSAIVVGAHARGQAGGERGRACPLHMSGAGAGSAFNATAHSAADLISLDERLEDPAHRLVERRGC